MGTEPMRRRFPAAWRLLALAVACGLASVALQQLAPDRTPALLVGLLFGAGLGLAFAALLAWQLPDACDAAPPALRRRYTREMLLAMAVYVVVLLVSTQLLQHMQLTLPQRALVALLPVPPIAMALRAMLRYIRDVDEMQQRIELESIGLATACVALGYMTGGLLQSAKVIDVPASVAMLWVFPLLSMGYGLAKAVVARRYR